MLNADQKALLDYIEETAPALPIRLRLRIYRGLADCLDDPVPRRRLLKKVRILETAERRCDRL